MNDGGNDYNGMSKYSVYRQIRQERTYRPLGRMTWWRVVIGLLLLASVFFLSGAVSQFFAVRGHFHTAERLLLSPAWVEKYRPELRDFLAAGVLYEDGDYAAAADAFGAVAELDAAVTMRSVSLAALAGE
ncbi:MAG: hypothetical protein IJ594_00620, partial [Oscillospiraceae bacterium]|nr:hypothetical protein [Oscillospiraceae bacterium]